MPSERRKAILEERARKPFDGFLEGVVLAPLEQDKPKRRALPNRKALTADPEADISARDRAAAQAARVYRHILPGIVSYLREVGDPRSPRGMKHDFAALMFHAVLMFSFGIGSRRRSNRELASRDAFDTLSAVFPELTSMPHADTVANMLERVDPDALQGQYAKMLGKMAAGAEFRDRYAEGGRLTVAIDGSQSFTREYRWAAKALCRHLGKERVEQFYSFHVESVAVLKNGAVIPLLTETLENGEADGDSKQDCEQKAFARIAERLHGVFGRGTLNIVLDGLYATGPAISICEKYGWGYMIALKDDCLSTVWEDAEGLMRLEPGNSLACNWGERGQEYRWANGLEYTYGNNHKKLTLNVVVCCESWDEAHPRSGGRPERVRKKYAWLSSETVTCVNAFDRCTRLARSRWRIENNFLVEKRQGYSFEHCFSYNWNAMKSYHCLMRIAHLINTLAVYSAALTEHVASTGIRGFIRFVWACLSTSDERLRAVLREASKKPIRQRMSERNIFLAPSQ
jgi:hypothetical protein